MLEIENLNVIFGTGEHAIRAVNNASFFIKTGDSFGLVGESGSGKSTILTCVSGLNRIWSGQIRVNGKIQDYKRNRQFFSQVQIVFQDPYGSLHPRFTVDQTLKEPLIIHKMGDYNQRISRVLEEVGLGNQFRFRFPHQLSGGQRQRVAIARALILEPKLLLLDEPTSALDVSIQAEVLNLLKQVQYERNLTYLLVSHNLAVVSHMCNDIAVMNRGCIVEKLNKKQLQHEDLSHSYTKQLLTASKGFDRQIIDAFKDFDMDESESNLV
ncbi:ABC transporter ATP-binding protein [bacterium]|nr:ABC transporter ATP-binding protein [bacterium]